MPRSLPDSVSGSRKPCLNVQGRDERHAAQCQAASGVKAPPSAACSRFSAMGAEMSFSAAMWAGDRLTPAERGEPPGNRSQKLYSYDSQKLHLYKNARSRYRRAISWCTLH